MSKRVTGAGLYILGKRLQERTRTNGSAGGAVMETGEQGRLKSQEGA